MRLAVLKIQQGGLVVGVGLHPIRPVPDAIFTQEDITTPKCRDTIRKHMTENDFTGFDVVMRGDGLSSDTLATPWDQASQLTESIKLATEFLSPKGAFVTKMFDGAQDYNPMLYCLEQLFDGVVVTKPTCTFPETYIVAKSYKAPEKINPRLLVTRNLFSIKEDIKPEVIRRALLFQFYVFSFIDEIQPFNSLSYVFLGEVLFWQSQHKVPWYDHCVHHCKGIDPGIVMGSDGLVTGRTTCIEDDIKVKEIGVDILCGQSGHYDFAETVYEYIDEKVLNKIVAEKSRPSVEKCACMMKRWYASYWKQCEKKGDEVDRASGKALGKDSHAFLTIAGYEDEGKDELVLHV
ncbi:uncharacterized protein LOC113298883 isoform X1 [Papaver somniferum]|uniref:uncharacterized protein LOC113298883 isoform X1 n=1 Tax=Papaver somniferum TaxID=3469 RepID=UPI000E700D7C|nr:uncharacterized protein LOC113298883 isoform X1 [Papaver somniferum]